MWVEKTKTGKFQFRERYINPLTGKEHTVSITFNKHTRKTEQEALLILNEKIEKKIATSVNDITFEQLSDKWLVHYKTVVKPSTYDNRKRLLKQVNQVLGHIQLSQLDYSNINNYLFDLKANNYSESSVKSYKTIVSLIIDFGLTLGDLKDYALLERIKLPQFRKEQEQDIHYLEQDELKSLVKQLKSQGYYEIARLCLIQAYTGMRFGELVALDYDKHIDFVNNTIKIERTWYLDKKQFLSPKTNQVRTIHFNKRTKELIQEQIQYTKILTMKQGLKKNNLLFKNNLSEPIRNTSVNKILKTQVDINKPISTHIFRHTFIAMMTEQGTSPKLIADHVGHTTTNTIEKYYTHFTEKMNEELANEIEKLSFGN